MAADRMWEQDREWFVQHFGDRTTRDTSRVADDRSRIWSPLARDFADVARDLFVGRTVADLLDRVAAATTDVVTGAAFAAVTLRGPDGTLHTPAATDPRAATLDRIQQGCADGPLRRATSPSGTGMAGSPDLTKDQQWPEFSPLAVAHGVRGVLAAGLFPPGRRRGALTAYTTEPRGLAAADPDVLLVLGSFAVTALSATEAVTAEDLADVVVTGPLRTNDAICRAAEVLLDKRRLSAEDAYDVLSRAARDLVEAWWT
ncbi:GAF domain-containing protein [Saccharopolyspora rosea]|uniref:GAF domain-containing protein n=1 Tax=Saccharopolyspora rosea TaxID=524884 RepID=A0ABW3FV70_9PSEU|nr:GAF domain-containing protein [Saccharopolyspora rosea]